MRNLFEAEWAKRAKCVSFSEKNRKWPCRPKGDGTNRRFNKVKGCDIL